MYRDASAMNFPIFQTEKLLLRMFEKVTTHSTLSENVEEKLLKEGMMLSKFWWRYISNGLVELIYKISLGSLIMISPL